jgi:predicted metalloprotease with PDZ domain
MLIYWSGAAIALMGDVDLRQRSGGAQSLDSVLGQLAACCLPSGKPWEGRALFARLDALAGRDVFVPLYDKYANAPGMPPWPATLAALGVQGTGEDVVLDDAAPLSTIRRAILQHPGPAKETP